MLVDTSPTVAPLSGRATVGNFSEAVEQLAAAVDDLRRHVEHLRAPAEVEP